MMTWVNRLIKGFVFSILVLMIVASFSQNFSFAETHSVPPISTALHVLPPVGEDSGEPVGPWGFDWTLADELEVKVCSISNENDCIIFMSRDSDGGDDNIKLQDGRYLVNWQPSPSDVGQEFQIGFAVASLEVGYIRYELDNQGPVPIKFRVENHPRIRVRLLHKQQYTASEIAEALIDEFDLGAQDTAQLLESEEYTAVEIGLAMRDVYGLDAPTTAQILMDIGFSAMEVGITLRDVFALDGSSIAQILKDVFALGASGVAQILKDLGFSVIEIGYALRDIFTLGAPDAAQILYNVGFSLIEISEMLDEVYHLEKNQIHFILSPFLIETFGPTIHFHPSELYFMSSVDWFLDGTTAMESSLGDSEAVLPGQVHNKADEFGCGNGVECWFTALPEKRSGQLDGAKAYVHIYHPLNVEGAFDLQFWLFYPYNGPGTLYSRIGELWDHASVIDPIGSHSGDWESVTIRFNNDYEPFEVVLSQHGDYPSYDIREFETTDGTHLKTYSSLNGHANYKEAGNNAHREVHVDLGLGHLDVDTYNRCSDTGQKFSTHNNYEIVAFDNNVLPGYEWIKFPGKWGPLVEMQLDSGTVPALLWNHFWPGVLLACGIVSWACGPPALPPYWVCFGICTGGATAGVYFARDEIINLFYPGGLVANGPTSPGNKGSWSYDSAPSEGFAIVVQQIDGMPESFSTQNSEDNIEEIKNTCYSTWAEITGISIEQIMTAVNSGQSMCNFLEAHELNLDELWPIYLQTTLQNSVEDGLLTQANADLMRSLMADLGPNVWCSEDEAGGAVQDRVRQIILQNMVEEGLLTQAEAERINQQLAQYDPTNIIPDDGDQPTIFLPLVIEDSQ